MCVCLCIGTSNSTEKSTPTKLTVWFLKDPGKRGQSLSHVPSTVHDKLSQHQEQAAHLAHVGDLIVAPKDI